MMFLGNKAQSVLCLTALSIKYYIKYDMYLKLLIFGRVNLE